MNLFINHQRTTKNYCDLENADRKTDCHTVWDEHLFIGCLLVFLHLDGD